MSHVAPESRRGFPRWPAVICTVALAGALALLHVVTAREAIVPHATWPSAAAAPPASGVAKRPPDRPAQAPRGPPQRRRSLLSDDPPDRWHRVLVRLSRLRATAWHRGRPRLLTRVYMAGTPELTRDRRMLRRYLERGLIVRGGDVVFGPVRVVSRGAQAVHLRVVDQLGDVVAVSRTGGRLRLPHDLPTRHLIVLAKAGRGWRIASVTGDR